MNVVRVRGEGVVGVGKMGKIFPIPVPSVLVFYAVQRIAVRVVPAQSSIAVLVM